MAACPSCRKPVPATARICHHCFVSLSAAKPAARVEQVPTQPALPEPRKRAVKLIWFVRAVFVLYAVALIEGALAQWDVNLSAPRMIHTALMPGVSLLIALGAIVLTRRHIVAAALSVAALQTIAVVNSFTTMPTWHGVGLAIVTWVAALLSPRAARIEHEGRAAHKFIDDDLRVVFGIAGIFVSTVVWVLVDAYIYSTPLLFWAGCVVIMQFALHVSHRSWRDVMGASSTLRGMVLGLIVGALGGAAMFVFSQFRQDEWWPPIWRVELPPTFLLLGPVLAAPVIEEFLCRGALWMIVRERVDTFGTVVVTALFFALMHVGRSQGFGDVPVQFLGGLLFGWLRIRTGSIVPGIIAHAAFNLTLFALMWGQVFERLIEAGLK